LYDKLRQRLSKKTITNLHPLFSLVCTAAPVVSDGLSANRAVSTSLSMMVGGLNFHSSDPTSTLQVSLATCATAAWTSGSSIACLPLTGTATDRSVVVTVTAGLVGTSSATFTFDGKLALDRTFDV